MNRNFNDATRGQCCADAEHPNAMGNDEIECTDEDNDGITTCDGDCNDNDPNIKQCGDYSDPEPRGNCHDVYECQEAYNCHPEAGCSYSGTWCQYVGTRCD